MKTVIRISMKTVIRISMDYTGSTSHDEFIESINQIVNDSIEVYCEVSNDRMVNVVEEQKRYIFNKEDGKKVTIVDAKGYSQSEWQTYKLYHNQEDDSKELGWLVEELEKSFTHQNDYFVEKFERVEIDGKNLDGEPHDYTNFCIRHTEFPDKEDVLKEYNEIYGEDYDEVIIEVD